jgi:hypothetical protein
MKKLGGIGFGSCLPSFNPLPSREMFSYNYKFAGISLDPQNWGIESLFLSFPLQISLCLSFRRTRKKPMELPLALASSLSSLDHREFPCV